MKGLRLEVGKTYRNREGEEVRITEVSGFTEGIQHPYKGNNGKWYTEIAGRPATIEQAQPLFDALKKAGKRWNAEKLQIEEIPEIERILEWVEVNIKEGYYNHEDVAEAIEGYLKYRGDKK